ncbi:queuosine precursor transporter [Actinomycetaceae bacterium MB13-C1-2]|nr:queuosine precursor transporter [Actinomycetaceae bacterium MB13-C1-2]
MIVACFVAMLLISNVAATKLIEFDLGAFSLIFDGGAVLFPFTYVLGDVLAEVYGWVRTRRVVVLGFLISALASLVFFVVQLLPPASDYENQAAFEAVLGFVPRIVAASLMAYLVGQLLNAYVLTRIKARWGERHLWARLLGSSLVGEAADTLVFCTIAFYGVLTGGPFWNYVLVGYLYKMAFEIILLPLSYLVIDRVKKAETR